MVILDYVFDESPYGPMYSWRVNLIFGPWTRLGSLNLLHWTLTRAWSAGLKNLGCCKSLLRVALEFCKLVLSCRSSSSRQIFTTIFVALPQGFVKLYMTRRDSLSRLLVYNSPWLIESSYGVSSLINRLKKLFLSTWHFLNNQASRLVKATHDSPKG